MPEPTEMPEQEPIFPVGDPSVVADMAKEGGVPEAKIEITRDWENTTGVTDEMKTRASQMRMETDPATNREKYTESQIRDAILGGDKKEEKKEGGHPDDKAEKKAVPENKSNQVWVDRNGVWVKVEFADLKAGEIPTTFLEGEEPEIGDKADVRQGVVDDEEKRKAEEAERERLQKDAEERARVEAERLRAEEERIKKEKEEEERKKKENAAKETVESFIKKNEVTLNKLLLQEWNPLLTMHPDKAKLARVVELSKSIHKDRLLERFRAGDGTVYQEMFVVAQDAYLKEVMEEKNYMGIAGESEGLKRKEVAAGTVDTVQRERFGAKIVSFVQKIYLGDKRRWFEYGVAGQEMKQNLEEFLLNRFNKSEIVIDASDYGVVTRILKEPYLGTDSIGGNLSVKIDKEPKADLIRQMIKVHDMTVMMDSPTYKPESPRAELLQSIDESLISMLSLRNGSTFVVPKVMETYDTVMREMYRNTGREIDIDNNLVTDAVEARLRRIFRSEDELKLFVKMGRDVCRITGVDAQYGYPAVAATGENGIPPTVKGAFLRGLLNYNKALVGYGTDPRLTGGINLGIVPFWNKLRGDEIVDRRKAKEILESVPITEEIIGNLINNKMIGSENYLGWFGTLKGFAEAKKAEGEFMNGKPPSLETFFTKVVPAYQGYMQFSPDGGKAYLRQRFVNCIRYMIYQNRTDYHKLGEYLRTRMSKDKVFDGLGMFDTFKEAREFFKPIGITIKSTSIEDIEATSAGYNRQAEKIQRQNEAVKNFFRKITGRG